MAISINQLTSGLGIILDDQVYVVQEYNHVKPGKGAAFVRVKLKSLRNDAVLERTFRSSERLDEVLLEERKLEYLYQSGDFYHFMDHSSYEEVAVAKDRIGDGARFLLENLEVSALCDKNKILKISLPNSIVAKITNTEPGIKGNSVSSNTKPATIETGATIQVPLFINRDEWIKIDTRNGQYVERVQR